MNKVVGKIVIIPVLAAGFYLKIGAMNGITNMMPQHHAQSSNSNGFCPNGSGSHAMGDLPQSIPSLVGKAHFVCGINGCQNSFQAKDKLISHKAHHTGEKPFACRYLQCPSKYLSISGRNDHEKNSCIFKGNQIVDKWQNGMQGLLFEAREFNTARTFAKNYKELDESDEEITASSDSDYEDEMMPNDSHIKTENQGHKKAKYQCPFKHCAQVCSGNLTLIAHIGSKNHLAVQPFSCRHTLCQKKYANHTFRRNHELDKHAQEIDAQKPENEDYQKIVKIIEQFEKDGIKIGSSDDESFDSDDAHATASASSSSNASSNNNSQGFACAQILPQGRGKSMTMLNGGARALTPNGQPTTQMYPTSVIPLSLRQAAQKAVTKVQSANDNEQLDMDTQSAQNPILTNGATPNSVTHTNNGLSNSHDEEVTTLIPSFESRDELAMPMSASSFNGQTFQESQFHENNSQLCQNDNHQTIDPSVIFDELFDDQSHQDNKKLFPPLAIPQQAQDTEITVDSDSLSHFQGDLGLLVDEEESLEEQIKQKKRPAPENDDAEEGQPEKRQKKN